jgi:hypothetical protein
MFSSNADAHRPSSESGGGERGDTASSLFDFHYTDFPTPAVKLDCPMLATPQTVFKCTVGCGRVPTGRSETLQTTPQGKR